MPSWKKWTGLEFVQDYLIPNSTATKNPLFRKLGLHETIGKIPGYSITGSEKEKMIDRIRDRLTGTLWLGGFHAVQLPWNITMVLSRLDNIPSLSFHVSFLLLNLYYTINQIEIRSRMKKVLAHREKKEKEAEEVNCLDEAKDEELEQRVSDIMSAIEVEIGDAEQQ